jgi:hypothetical protein
LARSQVIIEFCACEARFEFIIMTDFMKMKNFHITFRPHFVSKRRDFWHVQKERFNLRSIAISILRILIGTSDFLQAVREVKNPENVRISVF